MRKVKVAIIGAGIAGVCAGVQLKRAVTSDFLILEKADGVGGTWRENRYPGVECDVPSHLYSFSFELNPSWTREYPSGGEILEYLNVVADKYELREHLLFNAHVLRARFHDGAWTLELASGERIQATFVITALGILHVPKYPSWSGLESFRGMSVHTARWRDDLDLAGKRVGIVGTGATTVQLAPEMSKIADQLYVFQRSPVWVAPKPDAAIEEEERVHLQADPGALRKKRWNLWKIWEATGLEMVTPDAKLNRRAQAAALEHLQAQVDDPEIAARLTPTYNYSCKRPTFSNEYFPIFNQPNVELVTDGIDCVGPEGLTLKSGREIELDALIFATGFKACDISEEVEFIGEGGVSLREAWESRITSYRSMMAPRMPNLFMIFGPNSAGLTSAYQVIEAGAEFAVDTIRYMDEHGRQTIVPKDEEIEAFCADMQQRFSKTTMNKGCTSWWSDANGYSHASWPSSSLHYRMMLHDFIPDHFDFDAA